MALVWLGLMARMALKANPQIESRARFYARHTARVVRWRTVYPHLPAWAQEAAEVRGLAPLTREEYLDLSAYQ